MSSYQKAYEQEVDNCCHLRAELANSYEGLKQGANKIGDLYKRIEDANNHHVEMQRHRDAWRKYAYGRGERPQDFLDGNMVPSDRGPTRIEELERIMKDVSFVPIQKKQIDEMWEYLSEIGSRGVAEGYEQALFDLGFSRCEECGGSGKKESRSSSMREEPMLWTCPTCHGHRWRITEVSDE